MGKVGDSTGRAVSGAKREELARSSKENDEEEYAILSMSSTKLRDLLSSEHTPQTFSQAEDFSRVFVKRWEMAARSGRGVSWKIYGSAL